MREEGYVCSVFKHLSYFCMKLLFFKKTEYVII
uniref:Uncharacterized protein n=1 Tax=Heterorhabditis bacteriophora TaxID=37862 RepID=A0A1I7WWU2_HETBA